MEPAIPPVFHLPPDLAAEVPPSVELELGVPERPLRVPVPAARRGAVDALAARLRARGSRLAEMPVDRIIDSIDRVVTTWQDRRHPHRVEAEEWLARLTPYTREAIAPALDQMLAELRAPRLSALLRSELGDPATLDRFVAGLDGTRIRAFGPGLTLHVLAGNVPVIAIPSIVMALLAKSPSLVKPARAEPVTATLFARSLDEVAPEVAGCVGVWPWAGGDVAVERAACAAADAVICYGSDAAVEAIRRLTPARARFLGYGHRISVAFVAREASTAAATPGIAAAAARDVSLLDQQGCLSPHAIYVEEGGEVSPAEFARAVADAMRVAALELPRGPIDAASASAIQQLRGSYEFRAIAAAGLDHPGARGTPGPAGAEGGGAAPAVYASPGGTHWTVLYEPEVAFVPSCLNRVVRVHPVRSLQQAVDALRPVGDLLSTVGYAAVTPPIPHARAVEIAEAFGALGATRVCPLGRMQAPPVLWRHDGRPRIADLVRFVTLEADSVKRRTTEEAAPIVLDVWAHRPAVRPGLDEVNGATREMAPVVLARGLRKRYGELTAVDGIDVEVRSGECFGFLGPNGAGKSTTMKMIHGRVPPSGGELRVLGLDAYRDMRRIKARIGVVPQENNLDPDFTVRENLLMYGRYFDIPRAELERRADELVAFAALEERRETKVDELSGGMKRRLIIARALINRPDLVILDEPTTGLDPQARHLVWGRLRDLRTQGVTLLLTTHYMEEAAQLCDRLVIMDRGRILALGTPDGLVRAHAGKEVVELRLPPGRHEEALARADGLVTAHEAAGDLLILYTQRGDELSGRIRGAGLPLEFHLLRRATLEDVFLRLTGRALDEGEGIA